MTEFMIDSEKKKVSRSASIEVRKLSFYYDNNKQILKEISFPIYKHSITALIGPSGCGKTTLLRCFNRMHDLYPGCSYKGQIIFENINVLSKNVDLIELRRRVGMVFQKPTPFPMSIFENVAYSLRLKEKRKKQFLHEQVEKALVQAALWDEVKDKLKENAYNLSLGQQQRLVIARSLAAEPEVLLFDEPTSALDPISTTKIEELAEQLTKDVTIIVVTHNMQQAARMSDYTGFLMAGGLIEFDKTDRIFTIPSNKLTEDYITGRFG